VQRLTANLAFGKPAAWQALNEQALWHLIVERFPMNVDACRQ
jgi:hypothetical protein